MDSLSKAMTARSLRTIKAELEFLSDNGTITSQQLSTILNQLPSDNGTVRASEPTPTPSIPTPAMNNLSLSNSHSNDNINGYQNEKQSNLFNQPADTAPPPAYPATPQPPAAPPLTHATALYAYAGGDAGDLALQANDRVAVTEYMNADWWKGRNERTGQEGIFPRNYVKVEDVKATGSNYGNMPLDVAQGSGSGEPGKSGKGAEMGKKVGKKLGNAAIFGAGATIGSNLVNSIF